MSLRARSTSIRCSARSFSSARSSFSSARSSSWLAPRLRVPAIGRISTRPSVRRTWTSGEAPDERKVPRVEDERVGRGIDGSQRPVEVERRLGEGPREALRGHDLDDVAGPDVLLHALDQPLVLRAGEVARGHLDGGRSRQAGRGRASSAGAGSSKSLLELRLRRGVGLGRGRRPRRRGRSRRGAASASRGRRSAGVSDSMK